MSARSASRSLLNKLFGQRTSWPANRKARQRSLGLESLEHRALMAGDFADGLSLLGRPADDGTRSVRIINGSETTAYPSVGLVGDNTGFFCTGTLIAPQYVLTAGHCAEGVANTAGRFKVGTTTYSTSQVFVNPGYNSNLIGQDNANDIAIFKLSTAVTNIAPSQIYRSVPTVGQMLTLVGFGGGGNGNTGSDGSFGTKRVGTTPIDSVTTKMIRWRFDNNTESNTAPGDSGGPAFVTAGGSMYVAGVTSGGALDNAGIGDNSFDTRVDAFASWIDSIVGTSLSTTTVSISSSDASAAEMLASQSANPGTFTISRTGATTSALTVNLAMSGTAINGVDYNSIASSVTIPAGAGSVNITLTPIDDTLVENSETAVLTLGSGTGYAIDSVASSATVTIVDNDRTNTTNNDMFANRIVLTGQSASATGNNTTATKEKGEPNVAGVSGGKSVWWSWTAPVTGTVVVTTAGSNFDTTLGVYRGTTVSSLTRVATNDDDSTIPRARTSRVSFGATAGTTYQILVDGYNRESGNISLQLTETTTRSLLNSGSWGASDLGFSFETEQNRRNQWAAPVEEDAYYNRHNRRVDQIFGSSMLDLF